MLTGMYTNIERLHAVIEGKISHHGCGKTFAKCHEVAAHVALGHKTVLLATTRSTDWRYIEPMLIEVFKDHGLELTKVHVPEGYKSGKTIIKFIPEATKDDALRGVEASLIFMGH